MSADEIAQCAQMAMLLELSSGPKPGNVDRCHDFSDIGFSHFLASAVSAYTVFKKAASGKGCFGELLLQAVKSWSYWRLPGNTHFGSLVLMIPLAIAAGRPGSLRNNLISVLEESTVDDALHFYQAFELANARVTDVTEYSLKDPKSLEKLEQQSITLLDLMSFSRDHDLVAGEWCSDYERCFQFAGLIAQNIFVLGPNEGVVRTYLQALAEVPDSLIRTKFGSEKAREVSLKAKIALEDISMASAEKLDLELLEEDINPGSTADLIAA
ncbi:MAG: triphosphoribosyl-dephospho-CoA synthase, partial [Methanotrichaceae archaeon]|nr:triphosphoribosyl-dephospho-CoA synthase [Methanotrichaceae archaeon]